MFIPDQRKLLAARQGFDLQFPPQCIPFVPYTFGIDQLHRAAGCGIGTAFPLIMNGDPAFDIICDPRIERIIPTADNIAVIRLQFPIFLRKNPPKKNCFIVSVVFCRSEMDVFPMSG